MKSIVTIFTAIYVVSALFLAGCAGTVSSDTQSTPSITSTPASTDVSTQQADDILPTPGGFAYRGNINDPYPAVQVTDVILSGGHVTYRAVIQTAPGTTRNNIVDVYEVFNGQSTPSTFQLAVTLSLNSLPAGSGITVNIGDQWFGPATTETILSFVISPQIAAGDYQFEIGVAVNGQNWGTLPCTIQVLS